MAVLLITAVVFTMYSLWGMDESWNDVDDKNQNSKTDSNDKSENQNLINLEDFLTVEIEAETNGSVYIYAKDNEDNLFTYYASLRGTDKEIANALGVKEGHLTFTYNQNMEAYLIDTKQVLMTYTNTSANEMDKQLNLVLDTLGISSEQIKINLKEIYEAT